MDGPKLLLDENIGIVTTRLLHEAGFDIFGVAEKSPGITDKEVIKLAEDGGRIVVTFDRDFGVLVYKEKISHKGVIFLRLTNESPKLVAKIIIDLLKSYGKDLIDKFTVITENSIRIR